MELQGKVAVVTGAGSVNSIGAAYARALAGAGAAVAVADLNAAGAETVAASLVANGHKAMSVALDVTSPESAREMAAKVTEAFGGIDILVNNAALMAEIPRLPLLDFPIDWWDRVMKVNCTGALIVTQAVAPSMIARGGGKIINQTSGGAFTPANSYGASKLALVSLTASLAVELGKHNINVNAIAPGAIETDAGLRIAPPESPFRQARAQTNAIRAAASPDELGPTLIYLASAASDFMTGQTLSIDGGWIMRL